MLGDVGKMRCKARIVQVGNRVGTAEAKLADQQGKLYTFGSSFLRDSPIAGAPTLKAFVFETLGEAAPWWVCVSMFGVIPAKM